MENHKNKLNFGQTFHLFKFLDEFATLERSLPGEILSWAEHRAQFLIWWAKNGDTARILEATIEKLLLKEEDLAMTSAWDSDAMSDADCRIDTMIKVGKGFKFLKF